MPSWGYRPGMPEDQTFELNRWDWSLKPERDPRYVIFSWDGIVRFAAEITRIVPIPGSPRGLKRIEGSVLDGNHLIYREYVKRPTPEWAKGYNPRYLYE